MNISPNHEAIKISQADPGDLLIISSVELPVLVVTNPGDEEDEEHEEEKHLLYLGDTGVLQELNSHIGNMVCLKICDEWRFRLNPIISRDLVSNPASAANGKIAINRHGKFFKSVFSENVILRDVLVDLDRLCFVDNSINVAGDTYCFSWILEINLGGDRWEQLVGI